MGIMNSEGHAFVNSKYHLCPLVPNGKTVKEMLILVFLTTYNSRIVCKLKPMNLAKILVTINKNPKLTIFWGFNVLYKRVETKVEKERTNTVALKYSPSDRDVGGMEIGSDD